MTQDTGVTLDSYGLRRIFGLFATGVTVITSIGSDGNWIGKTVNSFTSVSLAPPRVLFCVHQDSPMLHVLRERRVFAVNILEEGQEGVSRAFASRNGPRFGATECSTGDTGVPILNEALGFLECHVVAEHDGGDHAIVIGQVARVGRLRGERPLTFFNSAHTRLIS
ncbi:flavin reductase [Pseudonocardia sp. MH-G8]|nr:flavin reductase [Pseudonocardia sp. MH-G8]